jgi:hypothetical protein
MATSLLQKEPPRSELNILVVTPLYVLYFNIIFLEKGWKEGEKK